MYKYIGIFKYLSKHINTCKWDATKIMHVLPRELVVVMTHLLKQSIVFFLFIYLLICYGKIEEYWYSVTSKEEMYKFSYIYNQLE